MPYAVILLVPFLVPFVYLPVSLFGCRFGISIDRQTTVVTKSGNHSPSLGKADNL